MIVVYCCTKQIKIFSTDKIMTTGSGKFKGPPSAPAWTFGSAGSRHAVRGDSLRRQVDVRTQHEARPRFHTASSVKSAKNSCEGLKCTVESVKA